MKFGIVLCLMLTSCSEVAEVLTAIPAAAGAMTAGGNASSGGSDLGGAAGSAASAGRSAAGSDDGGSGGGGMIPDLELGLSLSAGQKHSCLAREGVVYCWGENRDGQLGTGDLERRLVPTAVPGSRAVAIVSVGEQHTCWLSQDGVVSCFGNNAKGQLGRPLDSDSAVPTPVNLPEPAVALDAGYSHTCAILRSGELYCWGENLETQLGQGDAPDENVFEPVSIPITDDVIAVGAGQGHTVALLANGNVATWGRNTTGEAGLGEGQPARIRVPTQIPSFGGLVSLDVGQDAAVGLNAAGELFCWGAGTDFHLGTQSEAVVWSPQRVDLGMLWRMVSTETLHSCGIDQQGRLFCWGRGLEGQLGAGNFDRFQPLPVEVTGPTSWKLVSAGRFHTCAISDDDRLWCAGDNPDGELGTGDTDRHNVLTEVTLP